MTKCHSTVLLFLGVLALRFKETYSKFLVSVNTSQIEGCLRSDKSFLSFIELSFNQCATECFLRPQCTSIKYNRRFKLCELLDIARNGTQLTAGQNLPGCVYVRKTDIEVLDQLPSICDACVTGETCDVENFQCVRQECQNLNVTSGIVYGNINSNGLRVKYACHPGYVPAYMQSVSSCDNGMWNPFPMCLADQSNLTNAALRKPTNMSSKWGIAGSDLGVDGNTNQEFAMGTCFHTLNESRPWWQVDLQAVYNIHTIRLYNRVDYCCASRSQNLIVLLGRTLNNIVAIQYKEGQIDSVQDFNLEGKVQARYVNLTLNATTCFHLCEVQVFGKLRVPTIGGTCKQDSDCLETAGQCIFGQGATTGKCFCNRLYRYNSTSRDCERACKTILDTFKEYQQSYILGYSTIANYRPVLTVDECTIMCVLNFDCMFFETSGTYCSIGTVSLDMVNDTIPVAFVSYRGWTLYSRSCT